LRKSKLLLTTSTRLFANPFGSDMTYNPDEEEREMEFNK